MVHRQGAEGCVYSVGEAADLSVVLLHPSHIFDIEEMAFVEVQQHKVFLVWSP